MPLKNCVNFTKDNNNFSSATFNHGFVTSVKNTIETNFSKAKCKIPANQSY